MSKIKFLHCRSMPFTRKKKINIQVIMRCGTKESEVTSGCGASGWFSGKADEGWALRGFFHYKLGEGIVDRRKREHQEEGWGAWNLFR